MSNTYRVDGMTCQGCARSVTQALHGLSTDASVQVVVDLDAKAVTVDGLDDERAIRQAVEEAGFDFGGVIAKN